MAANHNYDRYVETCLHNDNVEIMKWKEHRNRMWGPIVSSFTNTSNYIGFNCHIKPAQVMKQLRNRQAPQDIAILQITGAVPWEGEDFEENHQRFHVFS